MPTSVNVSLPDGMSDFVRQRMADERFADPGEYVRHLIQEDHKRIARQRLETALLEGIESPSSPVDEADWQAIRAEVQRRLKRRPPGNERSPDP